MGSIPWDSEMLSSCHPSRARPISSRVLQVRGLRQFPRQQAVGKCPLENTDTSAVTWQSFALSRTVENQGLDLAPGMLWITDSNLTESSKSCV